MVSPKSCKQATTVNSDVKPVVVNAYEPGAQNAQQSAHISQQKAVQHQMNMNTQHGGTTCPQAPMVGMSSSPHDANQVSCTTNQNHWQARTNAVNDASVGCTVGGGRKKRRNTTRKHKRSHKRKGGRKYGKSKRKSSRRMKRKSRKQTRRKHR